jgi:hypothetical protein
MADLLKEKKKTRKNLKGKNLILENMLINKLTFSIGSIDKIKTQFMRAADVFEKGKAVGTLETLALTGVNFDSEKLLLEKNLKYLENIKNKLIEAHQSELPIWFFNFETFEGPEITLKNRKIDPYFDPNIRAISNGSSWFLVKNYYKSIEGLNSEYNQYQFPTSLTFKK